MSVYVISEVEILDEAQGQQYRELAQASIAGYGGRYIVRGAAPDALEGDFDEHKRVVVVEFPDRATAERWYASAEYANARQLSKTALRRRLLLVDGVA
ncbi:DUF1330 domain-containing protein [Amycolatopsis sp., V23-08]|uniref:DUF1330 domain-containing protein n=1 Tax=Amycolatopsis heterodermiae TaxID=3110235 RepID=A0ABU5QZF0_9PSEU|nr:DUF1330 domain-containing protein [Amycolatopsis sp., V23-08]MEA5358506.1 DUF1330 domain-containing protein [Amycolatopsis sp., V23-08]